MLLTRNIANIEDNPFDLIPSYAVAYDATYNPDSRYKVSNTLILNKINLVLIEFANQSENKITTLQLKDCIIDVRAIRHLTQLNVWSSLTTLLIHNCKIDNRAFRLLSILAQRSIHLHTLSLRSNKLDVHATIALAPLIPRLKHLDLSHNKFNNAIEQLEIIFPLARLETLDISENNFKNGQVARILNSIGKPSVLLSLYAGGETNVLDKAMVKSFCNFEFLRRLDLNSIRYLFAESYGFLKTLPKLRNLVSLNISNRDIRSGMVEQLCKALQNISLSDLNIDTCSYMNQNDWDGIYSLSHLQTLQINDNDVRNLCPKGSFNLPLMKSLHKFMIDNVHYPLIDNAIEHGFSPIYSEKIIIGFQR